MQNEYYITQIFVFLGLVPVLNKLSDHHNLPLFDALNLVPVMSISIRTFWIFRVNQNNFLRCKIDLISVLLPF